MKKSEFLSFKLGKILGYKGFHYIISRFGFRFLKQMAFDQKYKDGDWDYSAKSKSFEMFKLVEKYSRKGRILCLGCGNGSLVEGLNPKFFDYFLGIDISKEAIKIAQKKVTDKISFEYSDIKNYEISNPFDLFIFEESLNYISAASRLKVLKYYANKLSSRGNIIVTTAEPIRFQKMINMIRENFQIVEDNFFTNSNRHFCVFH